jgi:hypothetical protein
LAWVYLSDARGKTDPDLVAFSIVHRFGCVAAVSIANAALGRIAPGTRSVNEDRAIGYDDVTTHSRARGLRALQVAVLFIAVESAGLTQLR